MTQSSTLKRTIIRLTIILDLGSMFLGIKNAFTFIIFVRPGDNKINLLYQKPKFIIKIENCPSLWLGIYSKPTNNFIAQNTKSKHLLPLNTSCFLNQIS